MVDYEPFSLEASSAHTGLPDRGAGPSAATTKLGCGRKGQLITVQRFFYQ